MLEINNVSLHIARGGQGRRLFSDVSVRFPTSHFGAIIGPSGCGKTTFLKLIAGIAPGHEEGDVFWRGRNLGDQDFLASEIAYVPQFNVAHGDLTAQECVRFARSLRVRTPSERLNDHSGQTFLDGVGLTGVGDQRVRTLSGGQLRRLALAMELTSHPAILLCDEVTSGLDPSSAQEIVELLHALSRQGGRLVLSVTHSLAHLEQYDSVLVLHEGVVAYHGSPAFLGSYFGVESPEKLYARLKEYPPSVWGAHWRENGNNIHDASNPSNTEADEEPSLAESMAWSPAQISNPFQQFKTLLHRRYLIFTRSASQMFLQLSLILGFPVLVAIFAWNGLPAVNNLSLGLQDDVSQHFNERRDFLEHATELGSLVSGIVMFQVILLTLMGANNSGREIAAERAIFEKERLAGLNPIAYVASKASFLSLFVFAQSIWMGIFVHFVCRFPGSFPVQLTLLFLVNAAITAVCLGISSLMPTSEQASLASIYLVGFQLPLSGAVLALPETLGMIVRPFISAYWSWSGILETLRQERYYDIVQSVAQSPLAPIPVCVLVLGTHIAAGLTAAWIGCERRQHF